MLEIEWKTMTEDDELKKKQRDWLKSFSFSFFRPVEICVCIELSEIHRDWGQNKRKKSFGFFPTNSSYTVEAA